jgi:hypothetical protein
MEATHSTSQNIPGTNFRYLPTVMSQRELLNQVEANCHSINYLNTCQADIRHTLTELKQQVNDEKERLDTLIKVVNMLLESVNDGTETGTEVGA